jgi:hypothetical protein
MLEKIKIYTKSTGYVSAEVVEEKNPLTAQSILNELPIESEVSRWGDEVYFRIPVSVELENSQIKVELGDLAYWPEGQCFCIFFGRTPASSDEIPVAASPVNVFGRVIEEPTIFKKTKNGEPIRIEII